MNIKSEVYYALFGVGMGLSSQSPYFDTLYETLEYAKKEMVVIQNTKIGMIFSRLPDVARVIIRKRAVGKDQFGFPNDTEIRRFEMIENGVWLSNEPI